MVGVRMPFPVTISELLAAVAAETARMSYPGSMSRGTSPIVKEGTKITLEEYFITSFPLKDIRTSAVRIGTGYERWHKARVQEIAEHLSGKIWRPNDHMSVSAKFLNTFMHQLMKYEWARLVYCALHLPLDARVFNALRRPRFASLAEVQHLLSRSPYTLPYASHLEIQTALHSLVGELNARPQAQFKLHSRIELNLLWV